MASKVSVTKRFSFDAAHRILGHSGKCKFLHGHRYDAEITVTSHKLNELGMVIDFTDLKDVVKGWIDTNWDHNIILNENDPLAKLRNVSERAIFGGREPYLLISNPTVEELIHELASNTNKPLEERGVELVRIRLYETHDSWADWYNLTRYVG